MYCKINLSCFRAMVLVPNSLIGGLNIVGCWLIYKAMGDQVYELCSYELMSANDAPERDPKDWYVYFTREWDLLS